jgi:uncharacterized DUF497 family protein
VDFDWDRAKDRSNKLKHGISFAESIAVFADPDVVILDASHGVDSELRWKAIGLLRGRLWVSVFTERGSVIRLISARRANRREEQAYGHRESET